MPWSFYLGPHPEATWGPSVSSHLTSIQETLYGSRESKGFEVVCGTTCKGKTYICCIAVTQYHFTEDVADYIFQGSYINVSHLTSSSYNMMLTLPLNLDGPGTTWK